MEQMRFNSGKPKLSYLYAHTSLAEIQYPAFADEDAGVMYRAVQKELICFLSGGPRRHLALAVGAARLGLEYELGGTPLERRDGQPLCDRSDAAFCAVCVYGESKYERGNFRKGAPVTQYIDCALRHLRKIFRAQAEADYAPIVSLDDESGQAHGAHVYWNLLNALEQPDWRDDRLPPVNGGVYDNFPEPIVLYPDPGEETENHDYDAVEMEAVAVPELEYDYYYASYEPDCGCGMCCEIRPEMVEVEFTVRADEVVYLQFGVLGWGQP